MDLMANQISNSVAATQTRADFLRMVESCRPAGKGLSAAHRYVAIPLCISLFDDQLTPVLAYRRLVAPDDREAPSFLFESVEGGERQGRHSIIGAQPTMHVVARRHRVVTTSLRPGGEDVMVDCPNPLAVPGQLSAETRLMVPPGVRLPACFLGGWVGYAAYDTVRYGEPGKLPFDVAPSDDRDLPDVHFAFYDGVVVFDHVDKLVHLIALAKVDVRGSDDDAGRVYDDAVRRLNERLGALRTHSEPMSSGTIADLGAAPLASPSNMSRGEHAAMLARASEYIKAGDIFQVVLGQRFERESGADPFDVYRALRVVNPSPYMVYMQAEGCILVASSPEILCRVRRGGGGGGGDDALVVTNRPLAGTRRRGRTPEEDKALEQDLLADPKERAEHVMLVDLGRNDLGVVCEPGTIALPTVMAVERYSHVMHISSTVTGVLRAGLNCWDALRATLPVGTISGAPKIRAMQIIDELEPVRRGPYGGGFGYVGLDGQMDIALALRTIVVPLSRRDRAKGTWVYHLQASGGIVADSQAEAEYQETVNKAAALGRAIEVAERAFA